MIRHRSSILAQPAGKTHMVVRKKYAGQHSREQHACGHVQGTHIYIFMVQGRLKVERCGLNHLALSRSTSGCNHLHRCTVRGAAHRMMNEHAPPARIPTPRTQASLRAGTTGHDSVDHGCSTDCFCSIAACGKRARARAHTHTFRTFVLLQET
jgi:hypothetical protein